MAVVDLGSTAVRLRLVRIVPGVGYHVLAQERVPTRLGDGAPGTLSRHAIDRTLRAVHRFFARHRSGRPRAAHPRGRDLGGAGRRNRERLLAPLRRDEGIDVQILSARDEARLGVSAALASLPVNNGLVADLGGASLQLSRVRRRKVLSISSLPLGAVRTTRRFLRHDPPTPRELQALRAGVRAAMLGVVPARPARRRHGRSRRHRPRAGRHPPAAHRGKRKHRHGLRLHQSDITAIRERLEGALPERAPKIRGLKDERADIILAGAIVIEEAMLFGGYLRLVVCTRGVRRRHPAARDVQRAAMR